MRILLIEDEPDLRRSLAQALREESYAVDVAADGIEGLDKALTWDYDAVLLDAMLPGLDGWGVLERLRRRKATPVIMLTARDGARDRVRGLDAGADDYVVKPFDLGELFARLRAVIRRFGTQADSRWRLGRVEMDVAARLVWLDGAEVSLTAREYALVEYLAIHRGRLVTRSSLYEHLFDENESTLSNLLDVHVSNVRKKLGRDFIATRRGHGYRIA